MRKSLFKNYVSTEGEDRIRKYQYKCQCDSIVYRYIMGPLATWSLKITPASIAPNTLTAIAFLFNIVPHLMIMAYTGEDLSVGIPRWLCIFTGLSQFLYMHFDNMDGKQARRTNSSSCLGMLYDHGLDSVSGWIMALSFASVIRMGNSFFSANILVFVPLLGFYYTMWEEYNLDFLNFGKINPVDEGLSFMNVMIIFSGIVGTDWWLEDSFIGIPRNYLVALIITLACIAGCVQNVAHVIQKSNGSLRETLEKLQVSGLLLFSVFVMAYLSPTSIAIRRTRSFITCFGFGFAKVIGHIQLAHCAGDEFFQWRKSFLLTSTVLVANVLSSFVFKKCLINEDLLLNLAIIVNLISWMHYILSITQQLTRVLNVKVFSIKKPKAN